MTSGQDTKELPIQTATSQLIFLILNFFYGIYACICKCAYVCGHTYIVAVKGQFVGVVA